MMLVRVEQIARCDERGQPIFEPVDLKLGAGDRLALRGPSGIGKTLLLRAITLLDAADSGEIFYRDEPIEDEDVPAYRRQVHLLAQSAPMIEGTVRDNLELAFALRCASGDEFDEARATELLERFELASLMQRSTSELSGGELQAVALVRALLVEPEVILLDEPTSAMDPSRTNAAESLVADWQAGGERALVWVSHDAEQLSRVTTSSIEMRKPENRS